MPVEPTVSDLLNLARSWIQQRDNIVKSHGGALTILSNDERFIRLQESTQAQAISLVGTSDFYLWEGLCELLFMAKNTIPIPKQYL